MSVQDACLLCMVRLVADCEKVPSEVVEALGTLRERSKAYIRRVCRGHDMASTVSRC